MTIPYDMHITWYGPVLYHIMHTIYYRMWYATNHGIMLYTMDSVGWVLYTTDSVGWVLLYTMSIVGLNHIGIMRVHSPVNNCICM